GRRQRVQQTDGNGDGPAMAEHPFEIRHAALAAVPADDTGTLAIVDGNGTNDNASGRRRYGFHQGRAKGQQLPPAAGSSLRKDGQRLLMLERPRDAPDLAL